MVKMGGATGRQSVMIYTILYRHVLLVYVQVVNEMSTAIDTPNKSIVLLFIVPCCH